jgi:hypothetical protein
MNKDLMNIKKKGASGTHKVSLCMKIGDQMNEIAARYNTIRLRVQHPVWDAR